MVIVDGGNPVKCACNVAHPHATAVQACGKSARKWTISWDVTGEQTIVSPACRKHAKPVGPKEVRLWGMHEVSRAQVRSLHL
jgi:hypothetical protein